MFLVFNKRKSAVVEGWKEGRCCGRKEEKGGEGGFWDEERWMGRQRERRRASSVEEKGKREEKTKMKGNTTLSNKDMRSESERESGIVPDKQREGIIRRISDR